MFLSMTTLWPSGAIGGEMSLTCVYEIMTSAREAMVLCEGTLDRKSEHTYQEFRATLKRFINENAKLDNDKIAADYDRVRSLWAREEVAKGFCELPEYLALKVMLQELLQREATFRERLERSVDPTAGECL
ncbi:MULTISPECIES: hypothetical protein [Bradyrhizobium]|uniref:hypothetical protein n=1 Tax=Bradyrhizobium TaxID=374 RepID=UPI0012FDEE88|nr:MULTISPECIES: hypothetical protein [Bradyrhizobium]MCA1378074.1 hypothetical protein [Bradyrhizobium sp. IC4060]MCA1433592.1 hypothetical protein [Bradyrhizobium sp. BRP20]MCA1486880.1 hypothetical protein [Bradyrhizobium sp. IC4061]MCA1543338.1 hypothetical protein [Bradyrhizobium sp. NBAIM32]MCA1546237.1 hypothetical protein [Bradyrhizobium sp. BRP19]